MLSKIGMFLKFSKILIDNKLSVRNPQKIPYDRAFKGVHRSRSIKEVPQWFGANLLNNDL